MVLDLGSFMKREMLVYHVGPATWRDRDTGRAEGARPERRGEEDRDHRPIGDGEVIGP